MVFCFLTSILNVHTISKHISSIVSRMFFSIYIISLMLLYQILSFFKYLYWLSPKVHLYHLFSLLYVNHSFFDPIYKTLFNNAWNFFFFDSVQNIFTPQNQNHHANNFPIINYHSFSLWGFVVFFPNRSKMFKTFNIFNFLPLYLISVVLPFLLINIQFYRN